MWAWAAFLSRKMPASISGKLKPECVIVSWRRVTLGADTVMVRPVLSPLMWAFLSGEPSKIKGLLMMILPAYSPDAN